MGDACVEAAATAAPATSEALVATIATVAARGLSHRLRMCQLGLARGFSHHERAVELGLLFF